MAASVLHNYDFYYKGKHYFAKNEWRPFLWCDGKQMFHDLIGWHLGPQPFRFKHDGTNYSFECSRCNKSIGSTFETEITNNYFDMLDDYFCAFMVNNANWFASHNRRYLSLENPLCLCK